MKEMVDKAPELTFPDSVEAYIKEASLTKVDLANIIGCDRSIFKKIKKGFIPSKKTVIAMGIALGLESKTMDEFLYLAGYVLCLEMPDDKIYITVINETKGKGLKRINECNEKLEKIGVNEKNYF